MVRKEYVANLNKDGIVPFLVVLIIFNVYAKYFLCVSLKDALKIYDTISYDKITC